MAVLNFDAEKSLLVIIYGQRVGLSLACFVFKQRCPLVRVLCKDEETILLRLVSTEWVNKSFVVFVSQINSIGLEKTPFTLVCRLLKQDYFFPIHHVLLHTLRVQQVYLIAVHLWGPWRSWVDKRIAHAWLWKGDFKASTELRSIEQVPTLRHWGSLACIWCKFELVISLRETLGFAFGGADQTVLPDAVELAVLRSLQFEILRLIHLHVSHAVTNQ